MTQKRVKRRAARLSWILVILLMLIFADGCRKGEDREDSGSRPGEEVTVDTSGDSYGVFLGVDSHSFRIQEFEGYDLVVIDAQELQKNQLKQLHSSGHIVYSYLNVGSLEKSREYYKEYRSLCLDRYENWPDEYWVDVTDPSWKDLTGRILPEKILEKDPDIDGLFLDNLDVYAHLQEKKKYRDMAEEAYGALTDILKCYQEAGLPVLINGADEFVSVLLEKGQEGLIRGVNQETVFTSIRDYDRDRFGEAGEKEKKFYKSYLKKCRKAGLDVFLLEYTRDEELAEEISRYCSENGYRYYIAAHVNLSPSE